MNSKLPPLPKSGIKMYDQALGPREESNLSAMISSVHHPSHLKKQMQQIDSESDLTYGDFQGGFGEEDMFTSKMAEKKDKKKK